MKPRPLVVSAIVAAVVYAVVSIALQPPGETQLTVRFLDADGAPTPAVVCIENLDTHTVWLPEGPARASTVDDFKAGNDGRDGVWVGAARRTAGTADNVERSQLYTGPSIPWWPAPMMVPVRGPLELTVPAGRYRISAAKGPEHVPVRQELTLSADTPAMAELTLVRWVNMAAEGWYSGDLHVHHPTVTAAQRQYLLDWAEAADVHVVNALQLAGPEDGDFVVDLEHRQRCDGDRCVVAGQEDQRISDGHLVGLNVRRIARDIAGQPRALNAQGAVVGVAHVAMTDSFEHAFPATLASEPIDYVEVLQFGAQVDPNYLRDVLDLGFRFAAGAGSDVPWGATLGEVRTYVQVDSFSPDAWFDGLTHGRSFVSNGPMLRMEARSNGLQVRAWSDPAICVPEHLVVAGSAGVLAESRTRTGNAIEVTLAVPRQGWFYARVACTNGAAALTSPQFPGVLSTIHPERAPALAEKALQGLEAREASLGDTEADRVLRERIAVARHRFQILAGR